MNQSNEMSSMVKHNYAVSEFYNEKTILISGSTGFLGMVLIEKYLRSFPGIKEIIVIVRNKRGKSSSERMASYFEDEVFSRLKEECPSSMQKVTALNGDVSLENCGLQQDDIEMIHNKVNLVVHCAATISFTDSLRNYVNINVRGTLNMLNLSKGIKNLESFVHVSTMYSNCHKMVTEEKIYPHPIVPEKLIDLVDSLDDAVLEKITPTLVGDWANTYTYSKNAAENLVYSYRHQMPVVVFRPSIITAPYKEPLPAWINKYMGPYGWVTVTGLGFNRIMYAPSPKSNSNLVPCDFVAHALIAVIWDCAIQRRKTGATVVNYTSSKNPLSWSDYRSQAMENFKSTPFSKCVWHPMGILESSYPRFIVYRFLLQKLPAYLLDCLSVCINKRPSFVKLDAKVRSSIELLSPFLHDFTFQTDYIYTILDRMSEEDKKELVFDMRLVQWDKYCKDAPISIKKYLLKDSMTEDAIKSAKTRYFLLNVVDKLFKMGFLSVIFYLLKYIYNKRRTIIRY